LQVDTSASEVVGVITNDGVGTGVAVGTDVGVEPTVGLGLATFTPLFQFNFFPLLMQVNLYPFDVEIAPGLVHEAPALTEALAAEEKEARRITVVTKYTLTRFAMR